MRQFNYPKALSFFLMLTGMAFCSANLYGQRQTREGYTSIFNGVNLDGWTIHGTEKWYIDSTELVCESRPEGKHGYLSTNKNYKNFTLLLQFKQELDGYSGVFFHSSIKGTTISGWQAEIAPPGQHTGGVYESYGRGWLALPKPENESYLKAEQWNDYHIRVINDEVWTWINGHELVHFKDEKIGRSDGFIALQIRDMPQGGSIRLRWRNILIREEK
jgi:hypothetical protein